MTGSNYRAPPSLCPRGGLCTDRTQQYGPVNQSLCPACQSVLRLWLRCPSTRASYSVSVTCIALKVLPEALMKSFSIELADVPLPSVSPRHTLIYLFSFPNPSSCTMALGFTRPLREMSTRKSFSGKARPARKTNNPAVICEPTASTAPTL
jgi:hypothetical protein